MWLLLCSGYLSALSSNAYAQDTNSELRTAAGNGDTATVISLLGKRADINSKDTFGLTALMYAVKGKRVETVKTLINRGADVNAKSRSIKRITDQALGKFQTDPDPDPLKADLTALLEATYWGYTEIVKILLDAGADVNAGNENGTTPLEVAATIGHTKIAEMLIEKGADVNAKSRFGTIVQQVRLLTPVEKRAEMMQILIKAGSVAKSPSPSKNPSPEASTGAYDAYVGEYETFIGNFIVTKEAGKLFVYPKGATKEELIPESETQFNVPNVDAKIRFVKNERGQVTEIIITFASLQNEIRGKRIK